IKRVPLQLELLAAPQISKLADEDDFWYRYRLQGDRHHDVALQDDKPFRRDLDLDLRICRLLRDLARLHPEIRFVTERQCRLTLPANYFADYEKRFAAPIDCTESSIN